MSSRRRLLFPSVVLLGVALAVLPAVAAASETKIEVAENCNDYHDWQCWTLSGASATPAFVTVASGAVVTFADKTSFAANITWRGAAPTCSATVPVSPAPAASGWEGTCKFEAPGTYEFEDASLFYPKATVEVSAAGTTPNGTTTTGSSTSGPSNSSSGSGTGSSTQTGGSTGAGTQPAGGGFAIVKLAAAQHGQSVHGSLEVSQAAAGGRFEVQLLATRASLASGGRSPSVQVGRTVHAPLRAGAATFTVGLDARARRALQVHGRLALSVRIVLSAAHGAPLAITRSVVVRG